MLRFSTSVYDALAAIAFYPDGYPLYDDKPAPIIDYLVASKLAVYSALDGPSSSVPCVLLTDDGKSVLADLQAHERHRILGVTVTSMLITYLLLSIGLSFNRDVPLGLGCALAFFSAMYTIGETEKYANRNSCNVNRAFLVLLGIFVFVIPGLLGHFFPIVR